MKITKSQNEKLQYYGRIGEIIETDINENGFLNFTVVIHGDKDGPVRCICLGRQGGFHNETWWEAIDGNIPSGLIREWSKAYGGLIFRKEYNGK